MLLTGVDNHIAGLGNMAEFLGPEQKGKPGYEGHLNNRVVTVASVLRDSGYHTYMAGKWHLGEKPADSPANKGFERDFSLLQGGGSIWSDMMYPNPAHPHLTFTRDGKLVDKLPSDYFSTTAYTDFIIDSIDQNRKDGRPFFAYLSNQAVHSPFAAPDDWLNKFSGQYDGGYDALRQQRLTRMKQLGIVGKEVKPFPRLPNIPVWDSLTPEQKKLSARKMEIYAAMLSNMDYHIGRLLDHLRKIGELDKTVVIFFSDNGSEPVELADLVEKVFGPKVKKWFQANFDQRPENWRKKGSIIDYGPAWAQASLTPFRFFKAWVSEGGIRSPMIIAGPGIKHHSDTTDAILNVTDIVPTILDFADARHPSIKPNSHLAALRGKSMRPVLDGRVQSLRSGQDWLGWELFGNRAIRQGDWKLVYLMPKAGGNGDWQLYNLRDDPTELRDLSKQNPEKRKQLLVLWDQYVKENGVILTGDGPFKEKSSITAAEDDD